MGAVFATLAISLVTLPVVSEASSSNPTLTQGQQLTTNQSLSTSNGEELVLRPNGNLVVLPPAGQATWSSGTRGTGANRLDFLSNGNLVLYNQSNHIVWQTGTSGTTSDALTLKSGGRLVLTEQGITIWTSSSGLLQIPYKVSFYRLCIDAENQPDAYSGGGCNRNSSVAVGSQLMTYVLSGWGNTSPFEWFGLSSTSCRVLDLKMGVNPGSFSDGSSYAVLDQQGPPEQRVTAGQNQIVSSTLTLNRGPFQLAGYSDMGWNVTYLNGSALCMTPSGI
jgi:hypothetical protein